MNLTEQIAKQLRGVYFGGNWTSVNLKETLADVTWRQAIIKVYTFNTIAVLVYHMNYYVSAVLEVLQGESLNAHDKYSFDHSPVLSREDRETFSDEKYGNYYRNIHGIIEHMHYHLGQIVLIKKILLQANEK